MQSVENAISRLRNRVLYILNTGITPRKAALTLTMGIVIGIMPVPWGATPLCAIVALVLGLNQAGIQAANYLAYPLQIALFIPFCRAGERFLPFSICIKVDGTIAKLLLSFANAGGKALLAWLTISPFIGVGVYLVLHTVFRHRYRTSSA